MSHPGQAHTRRRTAAALLLAAGLVACTGGSGPGEPAPATGDAWPGASAPPTGDAGPGEPATAAPPEPTVEPSGPFPAGRVTLEPASGEPVPVAVHVAADRRTRQRGLMQREEVPPGTGMLFVWPDDSSGAFWMKDTLVPLSIAFAGSDGRILRILDMVPCESDPCPRYDPGVAYRFALEVPRGDFERAGIGEGDTLVVPRDITGGRPAT